VLSLEIGAGTGSVAEWLVERVKSVTCPMSRPRTDASTSSNLFRERDDS
jgi:hypothetical protein